jgi:hypothetical protein
MKLKIPEYIKAIDPYVPGKPLEELEREYGISDSIKLASNENPLGPSPKAVTAIQQSTVQASSLSGRCRTSADPEDRQIGHNVDRTKCDHWKRFGRHHRPAGACPDPTR